MTTKPNDGGPAFPFQANDKSNIHMQTGGMSLRDYFAAQAMMLVFRCFEAGYVEPKGEAIVTDIAMRSYDLADAMLAAREETQS